VTLSNSVLVNNLSGGNCGGEFFRVADGGYNIDSGTSCRFGQVTGSLSNTDPLLDPAGLQDNGGLTQTIALQPDSPAVDLVGQGACPPPTTDQRGVGRPQEPTPPDSASDGVSDTEDNCPEVANADQADADGDRVGDACGEPLLIDTTAPKVISTVPKANATEPAPTANLRATFSEEMDSNTINATTFKLFKKGSTTQIAAAVSYNADLDTAKLDPDRDLTRRVTYKAVVTTGAEDRAGNQLDQNTTTTGLQQKVWYFTVDD
jgi:Bacterial Ig-like domain/Thrombospondin type 3 repeat